MENRLVLPDLPYGYDALEPHISEKTLRLHHTKHHATYLNKLIDLVKGTNLKNEGLTDIVCRSSECTNSVPVFNNAAQCWNHTFYWESMKPGGGGTPTGPLLDLIIQSFGSIEQFASFFHTKGMGQFGSGWVWLNYVKKSQTLTVDSTSNAFTPITQADSVPLLVCDVWEHAYYLEFQNRRADYLTIFLQHLVSWDAAQKRLDACL